MKINEKWHAKNVLGQGAPLVKRIDWHVRHQENCGCREMPKLIAQAIEDKKVKTCSRGHTYIETGSCPICWPGKNE